MKQSKTILAGFIVLLSLGGIASWDEWKTEQEAQEKKTKNRLTTSPLLDAKRIEVWPNHEDVPVGEVALKLALEKIEDSWRLVQPVKALADGSTVEQFLTSLQDYSYSKVVSTEEVGLAKFGLGETRTEHRIRISGDEDTLLDFYLGKNAPIGYSVYLKIANNPEVLIGGQHLRLIANKNMIDFRQKGLLDLLSLEGPKDVSLLKKGDVIFSLHQLDDPLASFQLKDSDGVLWPADQFKARDYMRKAESLAFESFMDQGQDPKEYGRLQTIPPVFSLKFSDQQVDLRPVEEGYAIHLPDQNTVGMISQETFQALEVDLLELTSKKFWQDSFSSAEEVKVGTQVYKKQLLDNETLWVHAATGRKESQLDDLLTELEFVEASQVFPKAKVAKSLLGKPAELTLEFLIAESQSTLVHFIADPDSDDKVFIYTPSADFVYLASQTAIAPFQSLKNLAKGGSEVKSTKKAG